jgi:hypothetical protein
MIRSKSVTFEVSCPFPTYGTTCAESQNLVNRQATVNEMHQPHILPTCAMCLHL